MPWQNNSGGPWGSGGGGGGGRGPWGGGGGGGGGGGNRPPDIDDLLRQGRDKLRVIIGGGGGGGGGMPSFGKRGFAALGAVLLAIWIAGSLYTVKPEERAVELLFGEYINTRGPGLHFAPWPFVTREIRAVTTENIIDIGSNVGRSRNSRETDPGIMLTGDENIVDIEYQVVWNISNLRNFLFNIAGPEETIRAVSESAMREVIGRSELAPILSRDRALVAEQVLASIRSTLESYEAGVNVLRVNFDRADPPGPVIDAFRDVQAAAQDRQTAENQAEAYANRALAEARGQAAQVLQEAEGYRAQTVNEAAGEAARFKSILAEYANAPDVTRKRLFLETMERVLGGTEKILIDEAVSGNSGVLPFLPLNELRRAQR